MMNTSPRTVKSGFPYIFVASLMVCMAGSVSAQNISFPMGGQAGTTFEVKVLNIGSPKAIWFDSNQLKGEIHAITDEDGSNHSMLTVTAPADVDRGYHVYRVIQHNGIYRPIPLLIHDEPSILESETKNDHPEQAQAIQWPVVVNGIIESSGDVDYYVIQAAANEELLFELNTPSGLIPPNIGARLMNEPELSFYNPEGSWLDPHRPTRLVLKHDASRVFYWPPRLPSMSVPNYLPRYTHTFDRDGWYIIRVGEREGLGSPDHCYQLRIARAADCMKDGEHTWTERKLLQQRPCYWQEREFRDPIGKDWLRQIWSRTAERPDPGDTASNNGRTKDVEIAYHTTHDLNLNSVSEAEPNNQYKTAQTLTYPVLVEGSIGKPGDKDCYRISVQAGQPLAFEVRTPDLEPPHFSPRLDITSTTGSQLCRNIYTKVAGDGDDWIKSLEAKMLYTFEEAGEYILNMHDLTSSRGGERCRYQLVVRPQIPHIGKSLFATISSYRGRRDIGDAVNLKPGQSKKMIVVIEREEGYSNEIALTVEDLPAGVEAIPLMGEQPDVSFTGQVYEARGTHLKERYRPERHASLMMLKVAKDATTTMSLPSLVTLTAWPLNQGKIGQAIACHRIPLMVHP